MNIATLLSVILGVLAAVASTVAIGTDDGYPVDFKRGWRAHKYRKTEVADENACFAKCAELIDPQGTPLCTGIKWRRGSNKPCRVFRGPYSGTCGNQHPNPPQNRDTCYDVEDPNPTDAPSVKHSAAPSLAHSTAPSAKHSAAPSAKHSAAPSLALADPGPPSGTYQEDFMGGIIVFSCVRVESLLTCTDNRGYTVIFNVNGNEVTAGWGTGIWNDSDNIFTFPGVSFWSLSSS